MVTPQPFGALQELVHHFLSACSQSQVILIEGGQHRFLNIFSSVVIGAAGVARYRVRTLTTI